MIDPNQLVIPFPGPSLFPGGQYPGQIHPGYATGRVYAGIYAGGQAVLPIVGNVVHFHPIVVSFNHNWSGMAVEVTATGTANNGRVALYTAVNGLPGSLITGSGSAAQIPGVNPMQTIGLKTTSPAQNLSLAAGCYFSAFIADGTCTLQGVSVGQIGLQSQMGTSTLISSPDVELSATMPFGPFPTGPAFTGIMGPPVYTAQGDVITGLVSA